MDPQLLLSYTTFTSQASECLDSLKKDICRASLAAWDESLPLDIETDASDTSVSATLSQVGIPIAFFSRTLTFSERRQSAVEKETTAIVESIRKCRLFLVGRRFKVITDQQAVSFMFDQKASTKVKNNKILRWRLELSEYHFDIQYRPGKENLSADTMSRVCSSVMKLPSLERIHADLCHPGISRLHQFVKIKNLPFSVQDVKSARAVPHMCPVKT